MRLLRLYILCGYRRALPALRSAIKGLICKNVTVAAFVLRIQDHWEDNGYEAYHKKGSWPFFAYHGNHILKRGPARISRKLAIGRGKFWSELSGIGAIRPRGRGYLQTNTGWSIARCNIVCVRNCHILFWCFLVRVWFVCHFPKCYAQAFRPMAYSWNHPHNYSDRLRIFYMLVFARIGPMDILNGHFNVKSACIF